MIKIKINEARFVDALGRAAQSVPTAKKKPATVPQQSQEQKPSTQQSQEQKPIEQPTVQEPTQVPAGWKPKAGSVVTLNNKDKKAISYRFSKNGNWALNDKTGSVVKKNKDLLNVLNLEAYKTEWREQQKTQPQQTQSQQTQPPNNNQPKEPTTKNSNNTYPQETRRLPNVDYKKLYNIQAVIDFEGKEDQLNDFYNEVRDFLVEENVPNFDSIRQQIEDQIREIDHDQYDKKFIPKAILRVGFEFLYDFLKEGIQIQPNHYTGTYLYYLDQVNELKKVSRFNFVKRKEIIAEINHYNTETVKYANNLHNFIVTESSKSNNQITESIKNRWKLLAGIKG